jgi:hypothetical protein
MNSAMRTKNQKLLALLIKERDEPEIALLNQIISQGMDWQYILEKVKEENIFYPFYRELSSLDAQWDFLNPKIRDRFKQANYLYISGSIYFSEQVADMLEYLDSLRIKILLLKGPSIDSVIYTDDYLRSRLDLDLLVEEKDFPVLEKHLSEEGYFPSRQWQGYPVPEHINSRLFIKKDNHGIPVHVHRHIINNLYLMIMQDMHIEMTKIWQETGPFKNYNYIFCLSPEIQIIYLCEHGLKHNYEQLIFLYEIDRLIRSYQEKLDWDKLVGLAKEFDLAFVLYYGLFFTAEILSTPVPKDIVDILKPRKFTFLEKIFIKSTLNKNKIRNLSYFVYLAKQKTLLKKIKYLFRTIFPPNFTLRGYFIRIWKAFQIFA